MNQEIVATELDDLLGRLKKSEMDMEDYHVMLFRRILINFISK